MGLGSILGKIGKFGAGLIPGGSTTLNAVTGIADVLGGSSKAGAAKNANNDYLRAALERSKLDRDTFALAAPGARMGTSIRAALAKNVAPASIKWGGPGSGLRGEIPTYSGGAKSVYAGLKEQPTQDLMSQVLQDELMAQRQGGAAGGNMDAAMDTGPTKTSLMDKIMGGGAFGSSILAALGKARKPGATAQPMPMPSTAYPTQGSPWAKVNF